jgi:hypothetical protein
VGAIAPFWDDLIGNASNSKVLWQQFDPDGVANSGDEYTLVSWENWRRNTQTTSLNFQVKFFEASGDLEFNYGVMTGAAVWLNGSQATVWLEDPTGTEALAVSTHTANTITANSGFHFTAQ